MNRKIADNPLHPQTTVQTSDVKMTAFKEAVKPLEVFVNKYCCPHDIIVVQQGSAEFYSGEIVIPLKLLD